MVFALMCVGSHKLVDMLSFIVSVSYGILKLPLLPYLNNTSPLNNANPIRTLRPPPYF